MNKRSTQTLALSFVALSLLGASVYGFVEPSVTAPGGNVAGPVTVGASDQSKEGALTVNTGGVSGDGLIVDEGDFLVRDGEASFSNGSYADPHSNQDYDAKFGGTERGIAVRGTSYFDDSVGVGDQSPDGDLSLDVNGQIGAAEYCDADGGNCVDGDSLGGSAEKIDDLTDGVSDDSSVFLGLNSGTNDNQTNNYNAGLGVNAMAANTTGYGNTAIGESALRANTTGYLNTALGVDALYSNASGRYNIAIGESALRGHNGGENNIGIGTRALYGTSNNQHNIGIGYETLYELTAGSNNIGMGYYALHNTTSGDFNTALGSRAMFLNTTGYDNVAVGSDALYDNITGYDNVAVGDGALSSNTTGRFNVAVGSGSLESVSAGDSNVAMGVWSQYQNEGTHNTSVGHASLYSATSGDENIAMGSSSLFGLTTGNNNIAIGTDALYANQTGSGNVAIGNYVAANATNVTSNIFIGDRAASSHDQSYDNIAIGNDAMYGSAASGTRNVAIGDSALYSITSGGYNVALGPDAMEFATNATRNVVVGFQAGANLTTGDYNIVIGDRADVPNATADSQLSVGNLIYGTGLDGNGTTPATGNVGIGNPAPSERLDVDGNVRVAGTSTTCIIGNGSGNTACTSDERLKENIVPLDDALARVRALEGISYTWKKRPQDGAILGVTAQNVESVFPEVVHEDAVTGYKSVEYATLVAPLIESVKELAERVEALEAENRQHRTTIEALTK